ncbi:MAG: amino acid ABC transporter substrate-binding protein [Nitrospirae bacterium GWC2_46_6]|nr:MAG: amino acid ABC transporter substrate-binding protein [Nitrospirae bacterium GWC2_46_6]OGW23254.1 MAG: amino acid ABC transporter substrate-binding protein [Nitrospirae bacterium GWB2_47_37]
MTTGLYAADVAAPPVIKLGMVNAQKGPAEGLGKGMFMGADAVFKEVNEKGGINGRKINLIVEDDGYEPDKAIDSTLKMIEEHKVFALFGYVGTPTANAVIPIVKEMKVPLVGLFTGAMTLRNPVVSQIINIRASYDDEAEALVDYFIKSKDAKTFGVFYQDDGFGQAVLSGTLKALKKRGMDVIAKGTFQRNTTAIKTGLAEMLKAKPDTIIMVGPYTPLSVFIKEAKAEGLKSHLATVSFVGTGNLLEKVGGAGEGVVISQVVPFPEDESLPVTKECASLLKKYYPGQPLGFVNFEGCITAKAMVSALEKAGKDATREGLINAFEGMSNSNMGGLTMNLNAGDHQALDSVFLTRIESGKIVPIRQ